MGKLNQVIAVVAGKKGMAAERITDAYHKIQKPELFSGISKAYQPREDDGDKLPAESKSPQIKVAELIGSVSASLVEMFDIVATQDAANCLARASVTIDGEVIVADVPVTHLLFLEKQVTDLKTFVSKLPTLDPAEEWRFDANSDCYATPVAETVRTKKVPKAFVLYEATKEHPAQVKAENEDILVGYWRTIKFSGAIPAKEKNAMLDRVRRLHEAVVMAREQANAIEVTEVRTGQAIIDFVFEGRAKS